MRLPSLRATPPLVEVGEDAYQEFTAGTIPVRRVITEESGWLVFVEHERGFLAAFDEHLDSFRRGEIPNKGVDYTMTWSAMTGGDTQATVIRLELRINGLRARPRLRFTGHTMPPLWLLAERGWLALVLEPTHRAPESALIGAWILGPNPVPGGLRHVLTRAGIPRPAILPRARPMRRRSSRTSGRRDGRGPRPATSRNITRRDASHLDRADRN
jgi:hypothetical protein